jgi:hypothetical protein
MALPLATLRTLVSAGLEYCSQLGGDEGLSVESSGGGEDMEKDEGRLRFVVGLHVLQRDTLKMLNVVTKS